MSNTSSKFWPLLNKMRLPYRLGEGIGSAVKVGPSGQVMPPTESFTMEVGPSTMAYGRTSTTICYWPKTSLGSLKNGQTSVIYVIEGTNNPQASPATAYAQFNLTYVNINTNIGDYDANRCSINSFQASPVSQTAPGTITLSWDVKNCSSIVIKRDLVPDPPCCFEHCVVAPHRPLGDYSVTIHQEVGPEHMRQFTGTSLENVPEGGSYVFSISVLDVFGDEPMLGGNFAGIQWASATAENPPCPPTPTPDPSKNPPPCSYYCISCPDGRAWPVAACVAKPEDVDRPGSCSVMEGYFTEYPFCVNAMTVYQDRCTLEGARTYLLSFYGQDASIKDAACP